MEISTTRSIGDLLRGREIVYSPNKYRETEGINVRTYGLDLTQATLKEWALTQGIEANFKTMTQAEKAMLRYQYVMANTAAAQGDFARTADKRNFCFMCRAA